MKKNNVSQANTLVGKNKSDWSISSGWFTGQGEGALFMSKFWKLLSAQVPF